MVIRANPVDKALWFIETHFAGDIALADVADACGLSKYHLVRAFEAISGRSVMRYVRGRRLTKAAHELAAGAPDILGVAIEACYASHEAFTRAFRDEFGLTPESVRAMGRVDGLPLVRPVKMNEELEVAVQAPRIESMESLLIAGLKETYDIESSAAIPALWQRLQPHLDRLIGDNRRVCYGVRYNVDEECHFDYLAGAEVFGSRTAPECFETVRIPKGRYAVFAFPEHISTIRSAWRTIWGKWLPQTRYKIGDGSDFERYDSSFDSQSGTGGFEIWLPLLG